MKHIKKSIYILLVALLASSLFFIGAGLTRKTLKAVGLKPRFKQVPTGSL